MAKIKSIRIMLVITAFHDYEIWQIDVKTTFLNGKLGEDVYMNQPEGLSMKSFLIGCVSLRNPFIDLTSFSQLEPLLPCESQRIWFL